MITFVTNFGEIKIELDVENTPNTAKNFQHYVETGFYENTIFHRVIKGFMIQGGGMNLEMDQKDKGEPIENEADKGGKNLRGTLAMARTNDPHSASSQFFINVADNASLDFKSQTPEGWGYCVFGKVVDGMDVVDKIKEVPTTSRAGHSDVPVDNVVIEKVIVD